QRSKVRWILLERIAEFQFGCIGAAFLNLRYPFAECNLRALRWSHFAHLLADRRRTVLSGYRCRTRRRDPFRGRRRGFGGCFGGGRYLAIGRLFTIACLGRFLGWNVDYPGG